MVKAPSTHGLDRKYKPWRKGKSQKAKKQGSLKHQLRGQERLLMKAQREADSDSKQTKVQELQASIQALKEQIAAKENQEQERQNAKESHGTRFLERQRLTRMERNARKQQKDNMEDELNKIAMDQIYVAHYPLLKKYKPLFKHGERHLWNAVSRAEIRQKIVQDLLENKVQRVPWISKDQYERVPTEWSLDIEKKFFGYPKLEDIKQKKKETSTDNRFAMESKHEALLDAADRMESELSKVENKQVSKDQSESSDKKKPAKRKASQSDASDSDSDSSSSDDDDDDGPDPMTNYKSVEATNDNTSGASQSNQNTEVDANHDDDDDDDSDSDSSSDSSSDGSVSLNDDEKKANQAARKDDLAVDHHVPEDNKDDNDSDSDDDFLVPAQDDDIQMFEKIQNERKHQLPADNPARGDKSQGWATQQQRPGKFKKKQFRR